MFKQVVQKLMIGPVVVFAKVTFAGPEVPCLSPTALAVSRDRKSVFVACETKNRVLHVDTETRRVVDSLAVPQAASGLALSRDESRLFVTCAGAESEVEAVEIKGTRLKAKGKSKAGEGTMREVLGVI